jgi:hypothetical protein
LWAPWERGHLGRRFFPGAGGLEARTPSPDLPYPNDLRGDLKHHNVITRACRCGAVKIALWVEVHWGRGALSKAQKTTEHGLAPPARGGCELEHGALILKPARSSCAVKIPDRVEDQLGNGIGSIRAAREAVKHALRPIPVRVARQLEHHAMSVAAGRAVAALISRAVEVPGGIEDQAGIGLGSVRVAREAVKDALRPSSIRARRQFEHHATFVK